MPAWMARIGRWTPNGWALGHLKDILDGRENAMILGLAFATMIGFQNPEALVGKHWRNVVRCRVHVE